MSHIILSHEYASGPGEAWYPHLGGELTAQGHEVRIPQLPDPQEPQRDAWVKTLAAEVVNPQDTVLVGHSIGGVNVLRVLEQHDPASGGVFAGALLVATPAHEVGYDILAGFFEGGFDWDRIKSAVKQIRVLVAIDDPVLTPDPLGHVRLFTEKLGVAAVVVPNGLHFSRLQDRRKLHEAVTLVSELLQ